MNYETVYQTVKTKVEALVPSAAVRVPNRRPAGQREIEISISVTETDSNPYTEVETKHNVSIDLLTSVPAGEGTERMHHIVSRLVTAFDPLQHKGGFWTDDKTCFVEVQSLFESINKNIHVVSSHWNSKCLVSLKPCIFNCREETGCNVNKIRYSSFSY